MRCGYCDSAVSPRRCASVIIRIPFFSGEELLLRFSLYWLSLSGITSEVTLSTPVDQALTDGVILVNLE